jgi:hypothetical protein
VPKLVHSLVTERFGEITHCKDDGDGQLLLNNQRMRGRRRIQKHFKKMLITCSQS